MEAAPCHLVWIVLPSCVGFCSSLFLLYLCADWPRLSHSNLYPFPSTCLFSLPFVLSFYLLLAYILLLLLLPVHKSLFFSLSCCCFLYIGNGPQINWKMVPFPKDIWCKNKNCWGWGKFFALLPRRKCLSAWLEKFLLPKKSIVMYWETHSPNLEGI